jgi:hypothetical protein
MFVDDANSVAGHAPRAIAQPIWFPRLTFVTAALHTVVGFIPNFRLGGTKLTYVGIPVVDRTPLELRRHAEHCRQLARGLIDERNRLILHTMANEFDEQALAQEKPRTR